ncbi:FecR family protein [Sphingobacterium tabacisoli]|uniref:FecR family protein n=1 Tax=Sphingobacterium tabacisoli TaxID=2044855 RepID=A0ABW5KYR0_9SPHI|nr:FecR family protein [Sphingobacterium tabacisoli]
MNESELPDLIEKYIDGTATYDERERLLVWYRSFDHSEIFMADEDKVDESLQLILTKLNATLDFPPRKKSIIQKIHPWYWAAAILLIGFSISLFYIERGNLLTESAKQVHKDSILQIQPGTDKAILTLADGLVIPLDEAGKKVLQNNQDQNFRVESDGVLTMKSNQARTTSSSQRIVENQLSTPRGGQYRIILDDGTTVWLNAGSILTFPNHFVGNTREVSLVGEAYFEVAENKSKPFIVHADKILVRVLGTHFNLRAYPEDKQIRTALVEGSVQLNTINHTLKIKPGELGLFDKSKEDLSSKRIDLQTDIAWKDGYFMFRNESITTIMRQLARWYDVEITYTGDLDNKIFTGRILRKSSINEVLKKLELTGGIHFKIEGRRIIVMP